MTNTQTATIQDVHGASQHISQIQPNDYTGIYFFCGTVFLIAIITLCVIHKISEKWRIDNYKLRVEEIKQGSREYKDLINMINDLQKSIKGIKKNDRNE